MERWHAERAWLGGPDLSENITIEVDNGTITRLIQNEDTPSGHHLKGIVIPGLVSAHSHAFHRALRGRTSDGEGNFWSWRKPMYELANRMSPSSYRALAIAVFAEMLTAGITTVGEFHYLHHNEGGHPYEDPNAMGSALIDAAAYVGIRLTLIDTAYLTSDVAGSPVTPSQARFSDGTLDAWSERVSALSSDIAGHRLVRLGVAAHSVRGVPVSALGAIADTARHLNAPLHVHVSEQLAENQACIAQHGVSPVQLLAREGFLGRSTTLVHATHLTTDDIDTIAYSGSGVCLCPTTEADLGDGIGLAAELARAGVLLSVGSDSNAIIDILDEARRIEHYDRLRLHKRGIHQPERLLIAATGAGAEALGWAGGGRIAEGSPADFVVIDATTPELAGTEASNIVGIVMAATRASITDVVVGGELVVESGSPTKAPSSHERLSTLRSIWRTPGAMA
ncbi:MAG: formimidoylglutamate deiminase [Acidimicrobiia bacterium]|nr:MAG: formimidoylglutamate deiminase [Acidimicrobiia bacterium]